MENSQKWPKKVLEALYPKDPKNPVCPKNPEAMSQYYIVVDAATNEPQYFDFYDNPDYLGSFIPADEKQMEHNPVCIFDKETALFLIGQHAIHVTVSEDWCVDTAPMFRLFPVFGAMIPNCLTSKTAI